MGKFILSFFMLIICNIGLSAQVFESKTKSFVIDKHLSFNSKENYVIIMRYSVIGEANKEGVTYGMCVSLFNSMQGFGSKVIEPTEVGKLLIRLKDGNVIEKDAYRSYSTDNYETSNERLIHNDESWLYKENIEVIPAGKKLLYSSADYIFIFTPEELNLISKGVEKVRISAIPKHFDSNNDLGKNVKKLFEDVKKHCEQYVKDLNTDFNDDF